ncbi:LacI family DNA-binding transcriptional regulator [Mycolicibacterium cosmeticum]|uniref:LacI family DNA-binding transcriptional regulator n=1 Tax=Mycolicibacterium cosmeticum TaxID=258533 RepID=UPI0032046640
MQDIADRVGVSKALVSLVFRKAPGPSAETRARVFAAADELGYRVNRTAALMSARRTHLLGVTAEVRNTFHAELVEYIVSAADRAGYEVVLGAITPTHSESRVIETLLDFRCEGIILLGPVASISELIKLSERVPVVSVGRRLSIPTLDVIRAADSRGIAAVVDHLVGLGHRHIVYIAGGSGSIRTDRRDGYLRAMKRHGLDKHVTVVDGDFTETSGIAAAEALLAAAELPTAVVAANDRMAIGVLDTLRRAGVDVPRQVSVTGFDNSPMARLSHLDLTTVSQAPLEQADRAVSAVTERLDASRTEPVVSVLTPQLIIGTTTAPARDT